MVNKVYKNNNFILRQAHNTVGCALAQLTINREHIGQVLPNPFFAMPLSDIPIHYQLQVASVAGHLFQLDLRISQPDRQGQLLSLPAWIPGSYMVRDYAKHIVSISACKLNGESLQLTKLDKQSWQIEPCDGPIKVTYQVYAYDFSVRGAYINDLYAFFNGTNVFLEVSGQSHLPCQLSILDASQHFADCRIATTLPELHHAAAGTNAVQHFIAEDYQELIDHPVLIGQFDAQPFALEGIDCELIFAGGHQSDMQRIAKDLTLVCQQHLNLFGSPAPVSRYLFITLLSDNSFGGLEHRASTALMFARNDLPDFHYGESVKEAYRNFLSLCSHEFFHTWHVKRIRPQALIDGSLSAEVYTEQLWIYEGFTSYYDDWLLQRAKVISTDDYLEVVGQNLTRLQRNFGRLKQTVSASSFDAWTKFYKQDENAVNAVVSYYAKGALLALCLDAWLRDHNSSLDDVVRRLWQQYLPSGTPDNALQTVLNQMGFTELATLTDSWLNQAASLPLAQWIPALGLELTLRPMQHADDFGGVSTDTLPFIGAQTKLVNGLLQLTQVYCGGNAHQAGLMTGDQLLALDGRKITQSSLPQLLKRYRHGSSLTVHFYRKDRLLQSNLTLNSALQQVAVLTVAEQAKCDNWLGRTEHD